jgi:hypothetical protein
LLQKKASFGPPRKISTGETAEKIFKIGYGSGEMTLFVIHGRKIARVLRKFREGFSGGALGGFWESSGRTLGEFWESSGGARGQLLLQEKRKI